MELIDYNKITSNIDHIIFRKPIFNANTWFCEVRYKPKNIGKKILTKTPRMKIIQKTKRVGKSFSFAISFCDRDINDDIQSYFDFVKKIDDTVVKNFTSLNRNYRLFEPKAHVNYRHSLLRKSPNHSFYMRIKLMEKINISNQYTNDSDIVDTEEIESESELGQKKESELGQKTEITKKEPDPIILTKINSENRKVLTKNDIKYGYYIDQYLEFCGIWGDSSKMVIRPVWISHQIVRSTQERLFLSTLLLNDVSSQPQPQPQPKQYPPPGILSHKTIKRNDIIARSKTIPKPVVHRKQRFSITVDQIANMKTKLKKWEPKKKNKPLEN
jgi:hypothetical protein